MMQANGLEYPRWRRRSQHDDDPGGPSEEPSAEHHHHPTRKFYAAMHLSTNSAESCHAKNLEERQIIHGGEDPGV